MNSYINIEKIRLEDKYINKLQGLYEQYMNHMFSIFGSGFVTIDYDISPKGFCGKKYCSKTMKAYGEYAKRVLTLSKKRSSGYNPINWYVDCKSGFFFGPLKYNTAEKCNEVIGKFKGMDIKCPWELGRLYHLVQLSILACADEKRRTDIIIEFKNEIEDFIIMNPVGKTVQWSTPMDTSIRIVNLLISYDILSQLDTNSILNKKFSHKFEVLIEKSLNYVMDRLEYSGTGAGSNHYLSNLVGIIYAAGYLEASKRTDECLCFGIKELIKQVNRQFHYEGSHFEGSTSYHRLSAEFVVYSMALICGIISSSRGRCLDKTKLLLPVFINRIYNMGMFTKNILKQNNEIVQIGDNDSGRLVKITPMGIGIEDNVLDHRTLLSEIAGLFNEKNEFYMGADSLPEYSFIQSFMNGMRLKGDKYILDNLISDCKVETETYEWKKTTVLYSEENNEGNNLFDGVEIFYYKQFGVVVLRSDRLFISMVIDTAENAKYCGHTHNDKLSIEVMVDKKYITRDPGGFIYTAAPEIRNSFRSVCSHNTIHVKGIEQNLFVGTFEIKKKAKAKLCLLSKDCIVAQAEYQGVKHVREVLILSNKIVVNDYANKPFTVRFKPKKYSIGYGQLIKEKYED